MTVTFTRYFRNKLERQSDCHLALQVIIVSMKQFRWLALSLVFILFACQPKQIRPTVTIIDGGNIQTLQTDERVPLLILTEAGVTPGPKDRVLVNGFLAPLDQPVEKTSSITLQIRRAVALTLVTPQGQQIIESSAFTMGEALSEAGVQLYTSDFLEPPASTPITSPLTINYIPSREFSISVNGQTISVRSSAGTVGEVLAEAGLPLIGLDYSTPSENEAPPPDGQIRVVRVNESITLAMKSIPYSTETVKSPEVELGQQEIAQPGINGLAITRTRIRYEDGKEMSRETESETIARQPQTRLVKAGTKLVSHNLGDMQYWYAIQMYATSYSPCRTGASGCSHGTASGLPAQKGVVAMSRDWYYALQGMKVYVEGYGVGVIGDMGGGFPDGRPWIDLGYNDNNFETWNQWVTVYFLGPPPPALPYILEP